MLSVKTFGSIVAVGALLVAAACGDSSKSMNPTAPSAVAAASLNVEATDPAPESGTTGKPDGKGKPDDKGKSDDKGKPDDKGKAPSNTSPGAPSVPGNPGTSKVEIEGLISAIAGTAITVNARTVNVPDGTVIRHGSRALAFSDLGLGDRVHVKARLQGTALEATQVKLQNSGDGQEDDDDGDDDDEAGGRVWVSILDATATEGGTNQGAFRLMRVASATLPLTAPLTVTFTLSGTATNGTDYANLPLTATFLAGSATADVVVAPVADALAEGSETVILTLIAAAPYALGSPTIGTVTISDLASVVSVTGGL